MHEEKNNFREVSVNVKTCESKIVFLGEIGFLETRTESK